MADRPAVGPFAEQLYKAMAPAFADRYDEDWGLLRFCQAIGLMFERLWTVIETGEPFSVVFDIDACPDYALPYLALFAGVRIEPSWTTDQTRQAIRDQDGKKRGTRTALINAVKRQLTGEQRVVLNERDAGAYHFAIRTYPDDTPNPPLVDQAILAQKPAGLQFTHTTTDLLTWGEINSGYATWSAASAANPTWSDLESSP